MENDHYIDRLSVDLKLESTSLPYGAQEAADSIVDEHVLPAVEAVLKELEGAADVSIPQIEIDVGRVRLQDLRPVVESRLKSALEGYLASSSFVPEESRFPSVTDSLREFAETGRIPWEKEGAPFRPFHYLQELLEQDADAIQVLVESFSEKELSGLFMAVSSDGPSGEGGQKIRDLILDRLMRKFPESLSVLIARMASWRGAVGGTWERERAPSPEEQASKDMEIDRKAIPEEASIVSTASMGSPAPDAPEPMVESGPSVKYSGKVAAGDVNRPARKISSYRYVEIRLEDIPVGASVESLDYEESPGPDDPDFIMEFGPPVRYFRKVAAGDVDRPVRTIPSYRYVEIRLEDIPAGASVESMDYEESPGPDAPAFIMEFGPPVRYYRKAAVGDIPVTPSLNGGDIKREDLQEEPLVESLDSAGAPVGNQDTSAHPESWTDIRMDRFSLLESRAAALRNASGHAEGLKTESLDSDEASLDAKERPLREDIPFRYVEIKREAVPDAGPVEMSVIPDAPGPDSPDYILVPGPQARYFKKTVIGQEGRRALGQEHGSDARGTSDTERVEEVLPETHPGPERPESPEKGRPSLQEPMAPEMDIWEVRDFESERIQERIPVTDAGLVLLHPFIRFLMQNVGLVKDGRFVSALARVRAVHLLRDLTGSQEPHFSHNLILEKILCGLPPGYAIPSEWEPDEKEKEETEALLNAVCGYWRPLSGSSARALRDGFILRPGTVEPFEDTWIVKVEGRTIDILLDELPWELSLIHFPWLEDPVSVEWQHDY